jgi:hypothetical protein
MLPSVGLVYSRLCHPGVLCLGFRDRLVLSGERVVPRRVPVRVVLWSSGRTPHGLSSRHTLVQHCVDDSDGVPGIWYVSQYGRTTFGTAWGIQ